jgi:molecular chaperone GrpE (heat shock protein)
VTEASEPAGGDLDEVATSFRRAVSELIDRKLEDFLPAVAALYHRLYEESRSLAIDPDPPDREDLQMVLAGAVQDLGKILKALGGSPISPQVGEPYDPLIHLAVGEAPSPGSGEGLVAGVVRQGTKSGRGRVLIPARVLLGRQS